MTTHLQHAIGDTAPIRLRDGSYSGSVLVVSAKTCQHVETMCGRCRDQWAQDWIISAAPHGTPARNRRRPPPSVSSWAAHAWDGETWHTYRPDTNTREAAEAVRDRVKAEHPTWGVKLVDETL